MFIATEHLERLKWHTGADGMLFLVFVLCDIRFDLPVLIYRNRAPRVSIGGLPLEVAQLTKNEFPAGPPPILDPGGSKNSGFALNLPFY